MPQFNAVPVFAIVAMLGAAALANDTGTDENSSRTAVFAGGCFWCMEPPFDKLDGVTSTVSGYAGGHLENPTYEEVSSGGTGHLEVIQITYDPAKVSYETLLETFWANVDPIDARGQFCDRGESYTTAIFFAGDAQKQAAERSKQAVAELLEKDIATRVVSLDTFYPAKDYHQDYYTKNPVRYKFYRWNCGRDARLEQVWGENAGNKVALFD